MEQSPHERLARRLSALSMGMPYRDDLVAILKENFTAEEAETALLLPADGLPLKPTSVAEIAANGETPPEKVAATLESLAERGLLYSGKCPGGETGYALHRVGFGFPQSFFWKGEDTPHARKMTAMVLKYFNREVTTEAFGATTTKPYRYIPVNVSLKPDIQAVYPTDIVETIVENAAAIAVCHCTCRLQARLMGKGCGHPLEVCLKFDEMAEYVIARDLGRRIAKDEALQIIRQSAEAGLVHFVDNASGKVKHNCNCCGCACWNVGAIKRRKIPRDVLMAVYFVRQTYREACAGCGACVDICPVDALRLEEEAAVVDTQWCIGCGVCATRCEFDAVRILRREDRPDVPADFEALHKTIRAEKAASRGETGEKQAR